MCRDAIILIVEDEAIIALDLAMAVESAGGIIVGPVGTTSEALGLIAEALAANQMIEAAVLDANLADRNVTPVVMELREHGVPMVVHSAIGLPPEIAAFASEIPWIPKPSPTHRIVAMLTERIELARSQRRAAENRSVGRQ